MGKVGVEPTSLAATGLRPVSVPVRSLTREAGHRGHDPLASGLTIRRSANDELMARDVIPYDPHACGLYGSANEKGRYL